MLRIDAIEPAVLFTRAGDRLLQQVRISIENSAASVDAQIRFEPERREPTVHPLGVVESGTCRCTIQVPDLRESVQVVLTLEVGDVVCERRELTWEPRKHWRVHMVPISHHDLGYTDTIEGVLRKYCGIYEDVLRFCEETEGWPEGSRFHYTAEEAWSLQHFVEQSSSATVDRLARYVGQGRVEVPALYGNQISGLCGHEELIRLLYPSARLARRLGATLRTGSITDVPGLSWGLPTVLAGAGVRNFFAGLPTYFRWPQPHIPADIHTFWDEAAVMRSHGRPDAFYWQGPDGGRVLVYYQGAYGCWSPTNCEEAVAQLPGMLDEMDETGSPFSVVRYGGYGCGDNTDTDIAVSHLVREWNEKWAYPQLVVSTNSMFFSALEKECDNLRVFSGELPHTDYAVGALSTALETTLNRRTHDRLHAAEKLATLTGITGSMDEGTVGRIAAAYDDMLLYDEHTWGKSYQVGASQDLAWNEKSRYAYRAAALTESVLDTGLDRLASSVRLEEDSRHVVVFNPLSFARSDVVRLEGFLPDAPLALVDVESGLTVPHQLVEIDSPQAPLPHAAGRYARGQFQPADRHDLVFQARDVPPLGYRSYRIEPRSEEASQASGIEEVSQTSGIEVGEYSLENRFFRLALDPHTGAVTSLFDRELDRELVDIQAAHQLNQLVVRQSQSGNTACPLEATIAEGARGPVYTSLLVRSSAPGCPQLTQEIILYEDIKRVDFSSRLLKDSTPCMELYFAFPFAAAAPTFHFEGSNSVIRPLRDQFPGSNSNYYSVQHWAEVADGNTSIVLAPLDAHMMEFGGLHPCYVSQAHHGVTPSDFGRPFAGPDDMTRGHLYSFVLDSNFRTNFQATQQADLLFRYALTAQPGDWHSGRSRDFGWGAANPLLPALRKGGSGGTLPPVASFCRIDGNHVILSACKWAEEGGGAILRLTETLGVAGEVTVTLPLFEIAHAWRTDLIEQNASPLSAELHSFSLSIKPFEIATVRIETR
jgi:alpha-mannosidase